MNWKRGLFRAWLVLSVLWCAFGFWLASDCIVDDTCSAGRLGAIAFVLSVPAAVFLLGLALLWVGRGFRVGA